MDEYSNNKWGDGILWMDGWRKERKNEWMKYQIIDSIIAKSGWWD